MAMPALTKRHSNSQARGRSYSTPAGSGSRQVAIDQAELAYMAAFRLREAANRMLLLARQAQSPLLRSRLFLVYEDLVELERRASSDRGGARGVGVAGYRPRRVGSFRRARAG